jgi:RNA polymerase sigma-70 factor (ECF subfamily)
MLTTAVQAIATVGVAGSDGARSPASNEHASADERMRALCAAHSTALLRFLTGLSYGDAQDAEDLLQETLLRTWRSRDKLTADVNALRPWLYTVARRVAIDRARARAARPKEVAPDGIAFLADEGVDIERAVVIVQTVQRALATLSPEHRAVIIESYYHGLSTDAAAQSLGIPEGTVKSRTYYALRALRRAIDVGEAE